MTRKIIDIGTIGNDGTGDSIRDSFNKVNDNFLELYSSLGLGEKLKFVGLSDTPTSYVGQENAVLSVNQTTDGIKFKQIVGGTGINVDNITNPNEIIVNAAFAAISGDSNPQLGGNLQGTSGGRQFRIQNLVTPVTADEVSNKSYTDTKISKAGINAIDPATGEINESFGRMTGPLILSRSPVATDDITYNGLVAATKAYVDGSAFGSSVNLYVATSGADARSGVNDDLQGRALAYAYRTIEAALKRAEELILGSRVEMGPYKKVLTYNNGVGNCTLASITTSSQSGAGFTGVALMSVDTIKLHSPGTNYITGDILTLVGGFGSRATIKVLGTTATPGSISSFQLLSSGTYTSVAGSNFNMATTTNSIYGVGATFDITYKVSGVNVTNGGSGYGLVSVRITGGVGVGAFGTANIVSGAIQSITVTDGGHGFDEQPSVVADLPTFAIYTAGFKTDFTGDYQNTTAAAVATRHIRTGMYLRGESSGALAQILTHTGTVDLNGNELFDVDIQYGTFQLGEVMSYGDTTKNTQITVFVESGIYEENYPLKIPQNVAIVGDEFRRVLVKPRSGPSSSPWAFQNFRRDGTVDGNVTSTQLFGYHYLTDSTQPVYPVIQNAGNYQSAAQLLYENKAFVQEEIVAWIAHQVSTNTAPFAPSTFDQATVYANVEAIVDSIVDDMVLGTNYRTITQANSYLRSYSMLSTDTLREQQITLMDRVLYYCLEAVASSGTVVATTNALTASIEFITTILEIQTAYSTAPTYTNPSGISADAANAVAILKANRTFIVNEVVGYIAENLNPGTISFYDAATCGRDVGYMVDAMVYDLTYGGNSAIIRVADAYWNGTVNTVATETSAFSAALLQLKLFLPKVISNATTWTNKSTTNPTSQNTVLTPASFTGASAVVLQSETQIVIDVVTTGTTAPSAATIVYPTTYDTAVNLSLGADRTAIKAAKTTIKAESYAWLNSTYAVTFSYNKDLCKRDVGLIIDSLVFDLRYGGYNRTISAALKYFEGITQFGNSLIAITTQLPQTLAAMTYLNTLSQQIISNTTIATVYNIYQQQIVDTAFVAESGSGSIITQLISSIQNIISQTGNLNYPKDNNKMDIFLCNDATMIRRITAQGHGGFMMVLDPTGQVLAKSPYCQESASFIGSTGRKQFAGGMFVDGFAGNLQFHMVSIDETFLKLSVSGLLRKPNLPASIIVSGSSYRINYVRDFVYSALGSTATFVFDPSNPYVSDVGPQTCTITTGITTFINKINHGLQAGATIKFSVTGGSLPTGLTVDKAYYVLLTGLGANNFEITDTIGGTTPVATSGSGTGTIKYNRTYELLTPGNRSMLSNDFTQVADLGYGVIATNGGLTEAVSMFTYYCQISYYSINGGQIRSIAGSSAHGLYALVAEGSDPLEVPTPTDLYYQLAQPVYCYYPSSTYANALQGLILYVNNYNYVPLNNSELEVDHGQGILYRYPVTTAYTGSDLPVGVVRLTLGAVTGASGLSGLYAVIPDTTKMTIRQNQQVMLSGNLASVAVRPSTGLVLSESPDVYRVLQFLSYTDPNGPFNVTIASGSPATFTTASPHGLLTNYIVTFSSTGTLPTGITASTYYYVISTGLTTTDFQVSLLKGGTAVNTSAAGSGQLKYVPQGLTSTLLRSDYNYVNLTVYQPNDYALIPTTATATTHSTASSASSSITTGVLTTGASVTGSFVPGMLLTGGALSATTPATFIVGQLTGTNAATATPTGSGGSNSTNTFTVNSATGIVAGQIISGNNIPTGSFVGSIISTTVTVVDYAGIAKNLSGTVSGSISFRTAGLAGTYTTSQSTISQSSTTITGTLDSVTVGTTTDLIINQPIAFGVTSQCTIIDGTTEYITCVSTVGMVANMPIRFTGTVFGGVALNTTYYVSSVVSSNQFSISDSSGGAVKNLSTSAGSMNVITYGTIGNLAVATTYYVAYVVDPTHVVVSSTQGSALTVLTQTTASGSIAVLAGGRRPVTITINSTSTTFTSSYPHGLAVNDTIKFETTGAFPTGLNAVAHYYVISTPTTTTFTASLVPYGTSLGTTGTQSGTQYVSRVAGRTGDTTFAVAPLSPSQKLRIVGSVFNWKGVDYVVTRYDGEDTTSNPYGRVYISQINLSTGVQSGIGLNDNVLLYVGPVTLKAGVRRGTAGASGTLTIRIALTRVTGHDLLEVGTGSYADTNYPHEIYGNAVNALAPGNEVAERNVGRVFYVTTDQYGNFKVGPFFSVDQGTGTVTFSAAIALSNLDGFGFKRGVPVSEFSTDSSMTADANDTVPTQNAVVAYVQRRLGITQQGAVVTDQSTLLPAYTGGFMALSGQLAMKGNLDAGANKIVNLSNPTIATDAVNLQSLTIANITGITFTSGASANLVALTGTGNNVVNAALSGAVTVSLAGNVLTSTLSDSVVTDAKVAAGAAVAQSKLLMNSAKTIVGLTGGSGAAGAIVQADLGLAAFDSTQFTVTGGYVTVKDNGIVLSKFAQIASNTVIGNSTNGQANPAAVNFSTVVDIGAGIKKSQYSSSGFLRYTGAGNTVDSSYNIVEMTGGYTGTSDNGKLIVRDSNGDFAARNANLSKVLIDSKDALDTGSSGQTGGYMRLYGYLGAGGILINDGSLSTDKQTLYWNNLHAFKTLDGISDAPITASQVQTQLLTTGSSTTPGQITGRWTLTGSSPTESRLQATYSADLAEYYEGDKDYEVGTVLVFGGDKEVTVTKLLADPKVAGVVSNTAAFVMYDACPGFKNLVALQGRVPCKVVGKIFKGDMLVTSSIPGVAVAAGSSVAVGTVVGKALKNYDSDHIGLVEIAVGRT